MTGAAQTVSGVKLSQADSLISLSNLVSEKTISIWASTRQNQSSGFPTKQDSNQSPQLQRPARKLKFNLKQVYIYMTRSKKERTKALISLCECTGWSAPLLFTNPEDRFIRAKAHIEALIYLITTT